MKKYAAAVTVATLALFQMPVLAGATEQGAVDTSARKQFVSISPVEAKNLIETRGDLLLIDVRSPEEYQQGALPGSTLIPFWDIMKGNHTLPKENPILLVCAVGGRSYSAGQYLAMKGYTEIYNLSGGLSAWARQRVPLPEQGKK